MKDFFQFVKQLDEEHIDASSKIVVKGYNPSSNRFEKQFSNYADYERWIDNTKDIRKYKLDPVQNVIRKKPSINQHGVDVSKGLQFPHGKIDASAFVGRIDPKQGIEVKGSVVSNKFYKGHDDVKPFKKVFNTYKDFTKWASSQELLNHVIDWVKSTT